MISAAAIYAEALNCFIQPVKDVERFLQIGEDGEAVSLIAHVIDDEAVIVPEDFKRRVRLFLRGSDEYHDLPASFLENGDQPHKF